jgi:hypothetical protein
MSRNKPIDASLLAQINDALLDSIFELSEADLDAEFTEVGLDPSAEAARTRGAIEKAMKTSAKASLVAAKAELARFKREQAGDTRGADSGKALLERIKARDPAMSEMMMAARKGRTLSASDEIGLAEDLADLEKLDRKPD